MKKIIAIFLTILIFGYIGASSYLSSHKKEYLEEIINSYNRAYSGNTRFKIKEYKDDYALIEVENKGLDKNSTFEINATLTSGPIFSKEAIIGLLEIEFKQDLKELLESENIKSNFEVEYDGILDFLGVMHEKSRFTTFKYQDDDFELYIAPIAIDSNSILKTLKEKTLIKTNRIVIKNLAQNGKIDIKKPSFLMKNEAYKKDDILLFGFYNIKSDDIFIYKYNQKIIHFGADFKLDLKKEKEDFVNLYMDLKISEKEDNNKFYSSKELDLEPIKNLIAKVEVRNLGYEGIKELNKLDKESDKLNKDLALALQKNDDIEMQKAIVKLNSLEDRWVDVYNKLLIKNKTQIKFHQTVQRTKKSRVDINIKFIGDKLKGNAREALIYLGVNSDKIFEGDFDFVLEKKLLEEFYPEVDLILDAMSKKGLATLKDGLYYLKAKFKDGKIIINGTKYSPQELALLILI
jgi:hypothetical protein